MLILHLNQIHILEVVLDSHMAIENLEDNTAIFKEWDELSENERSMCETWVEMVSKASSELSKCFGETLTL